MKKRLVPCFTYLLFSSNFLWWKQLLFIGIIPLKLVAYLKTFFLKSKSPGSSKRDFSDHNTMLQAIFKMCQKMGLSFRKKNIEKDLENFPYFEKQIWRWTTFNEQIRFIKLQCVMLNKKSLFVMFQGGKHDMNFSEYVFSRVFLWA